MPEWTWRASDYGPSIINLYRDGKPAAELSFIAQPPKRLATLCDYIVGTLNAHEFQQ